MDTTFTRSSGTLHTNSGVDNQPGDSDGSWLTTYSAAPSDASPDQALGASSWSNSLAETRAEVAQTGANIRLHEQTLAEIAHRDAVARHARALTAHREALVRLRDAVETREARELEQQLRDAQEASATRTRMLVTDC